MKNASISMKLVFTPDWFLGKDVLIEFFSFLVLVAFFIYCLKCYKLSENKKTKYLGWGFLLIALAQLSVILTKIILYYDTSFTQEIGQMIVSYDVIKSVDIFYDFGFFLHKFLTLIGLYIIYRLPMQKTDIRDYILGGYFIIISAIASFDMYFLFHITAIVLFFMIIENYYEISKKNHSRNTEILILGFSIIGFAHFIFALSGMSKIFNVTANLVELIGYTILLVLMIKIFYYGKKKKQD